MENTEKVYTQAEVDAITEKVKQNQQSKFERNYVSRDDYGKLEEQYNNLVKANKSQGIKNAFMNLGGLEKSFDDMLALHPNILNIEDDSKLGSELSKIKEQRPYFFDNIYYNSNQNNVHSQQFVDDGAVMIDMLKETPNKEYTKTIVAIDGEDETNKFF